MMEELDLLKKDWKRNENSFTQVSEVEIYKMLHKKSSSIVKWILVISILEVLLWTLISVFYNSDEYLKKMNSDYLIEYFKYLTIFNYAVISIFIYLFYKNYASISTTTSTKKLMSDILKTRKTVQYYVWYNLAMIAISMIIGFVLAFSINPEIHKLIENQKVFMITIVICIFALLLFLVIFWLFYKLIYGILLRRLLNNYKELKKIDL
jgi:ABC-type multidrug transport system fused ATPase/permease subunit